MRNELVGQARHLDTGQFITESRAPSIHCIYLYAGQCISKARQYTLDSCTTDDIFSSQQIVGPQSAHTILHCQGWQYILMDSPGNFKTLTSG